MRQSPRIRRLKNDRKAMEKLRSESTIIDFDVSGNPTNKYTIRFHGKGLWRPNGSSKVQLRELHQVRVVLGAAYPRMMPELNWLTPIFHPNISASGVVCLGGYGTHWVPSLSLDELCEMLWDMIRYENYDTESPYNREAALWAKAQTTFALPLDGRSIRNRIAGNAIDSPLTVTKEPTKSTSGRRTGASGPDVQIMDDEFDEIIDAELLDNNDQDIVFLD